MNTHHPNYDHSKVHADCIMRMEDYFMDRIIDLIDQGKLADADSMHGEFMVNGCESADWMFMEDMTAYE